VGRGATGQAVTQHSLLNQKISRNDHVQLCQFALCDAPCIAPAHPTIGQCQCDGHGGQNEEQVQQVRNHHFNPSCRPGTSLLTNCGLLGENSFVRVLFCVEPRVLYLFCAVKAFFRARLSAPCELMLDFC